MKKIMVILFVLLVSGCSTKFAYNNLSWLVYWYLDDYIELNNEQEKQFDEMLGNWMVWHKTNELPKYQAQLEEIIVDIKNNNINYKTIDAYRERTKLHWATVRSHISADLALLGATLTNEQIDQLFKQLEKENIEDEKEILERSELSYEKRTEKWINKNEKKTKRWLGKLSKEQQDFIVGFNDSYESTGKYWIAYKRDYQLHLRKVFNKPKHDESFRSELASLIIDPEQFRTKEFVAAMHANRKISADYMLGLLEMSSEKQVTKLLNEIDDLIDDIESMQKH